MTKLLLAGTALMGAALFAAPAAAQLKLGIGGHFSGYVVYADDDAAPDNKDFGIRRDTEIYFTGETTLDNGLTVGIHVEQNIEAGDINNESYVYFSGGWGRVNFGNEDGVAYLLQVAAPSADSNVDGLRTTIQGFDFGTTAFALDYDHAHFGSDSSGFRQTDRLTYLTPKLNGFQAGVSYAVEAFRQPGIRSIVSLGAEDFWEVAARWDGQFEGLGISLGAGYSTADIFSIGIDMEAWNVGLNLAWNQFSFGAAYLHEENATLPNADSKTWVVGAAWDNGPWHVGASYLAREDKSAIAERDSSKATIGGGYAFGPGMTFRGAVAFGQALSLAGTEEDFTQVTLGTDIRF